MEIYWDFLGYATELDREARPSASAGPAQAAELRYRGILEMTQKDASSPELPHYDKVIRQPASLARPDRLLHALRRRPRTAGARSMTATSS